MGETDTAQIRDAALVHAAQAGDRTAFATLVERHWPLLTGLCRRALQDRMAAEEAAQEAVLQAMLCIDSLRRPERFGTWLGGIGLNVCRMALRTRSPVALSWEALAGERIVAEPVDWGPTPAELAEDAEVRERIVAAVAALPRGQRAAVTLFYLAGLSHIETAAMLGIETSAVKARLHKARRSLRQHLWTLAEEVGMATTAVQDTAVEVQVIDIRRGRPDARRLYPYTVILQDVGSDARVSFVCGPFEGESLALTLADVAAPRPLPYTLAVDMLTATGGTVRSVHISKVTQDVVYAVVVVAGHGTEQRVDARPSDAVHIALRTRAPIFVDRSAWEAMRGWLAHPLAERNLYGPETEGRAEIVAEWQQRWSGQALATREAMTVELPIAVDFARFSTDARRALDAAEDEARGFGHNYVGTEHQLLGLIRVEDATAGHVLRSLGVTIDGARAALRTIYDRRSAPMSERLGMAPRAKRVLALARLEAERLGSETIGTEHLLLGIVREGNGIAAGMLEQIGVSLESVRQRVTDT